MEEEKVITPEELEEVAGGARGRYDSTRVYCTSEDCGYSKTYGYNIYVDLTKDKCPKCRKDTLTFEFIPA